MQTPLYSYMGGIIRKTGGTLLEIGGISNHVHLLVEVSNLDHFTKILRTVKSGSTSWLKSEFPEAKHFGWQDGYGSFCVSSSLLETASKYIQNQEKHHAKITFEDEYIKMLDLHGVAYDPRYVFD